MRATRAAGTTDFWTLARGRWLPSETDNYVPKIIAAAIIGKHPERYGFVGLKYLDAFDFDSVVVPASTRVDVIARCSGIPQDALQELNPGIRRFALPPDPATHRVRIGKGTLEAFTPCFEAIPSDERVTQLQRHVVKRGESLAGIARKYGVPVAELARTNGLATKSRLRVGTELVVPVDKATGKVVEVAASEPAKPAAKAAPEPKKPASTEASAAKTHVVRTGDTLSGIASANGVTIAQLQAWNGLKGAKIQVGQKLLVSAPAEQATTAASERPKAESKAPAKKAKTIRYTVRRGDTLGSIADRYDCTIAELKAWNNLKGSTIYAGQKLVIKD
jgi:membrane-bound lytic murein transglycosylase D